MGVGGREDDGGGEGEGEERGVLWGGEESGDEGRELEIQGGEERWFGGGSGREYKFWFWEATLEADSERSVRLGYIRWLPLGKDVGRYARCSEDFAV